MATWFWTWHILGVALFLRGRAACFEGPPPIQRCGTLQLMIFRLSVSVAYVKFAEGNDQLDMAHMSGGCRISGQITATKPPVGHPKWWFGTGIPLLLQVQELSQYPQMKHPQIWGMFDCNA